MSLLFRVMGTFVGGVALAYAVHAAPFAFITNCGSNDVSVIDTASERVVATIPVGACPYGVAVSPGGAHAYVTNRDDDSLSVIDATAFRETTRIAVGTHPIGVAVDPSGRRVYVANRRSDSISVVDTAARAVVATVSVASVARSPGGRRRASGRVAGLRDCAMALRVLFGLRAGGEHGDARHRRHDRGRLSR